MNSLCVAALVSFSCAIAAADQPAKPKPSFREFIGLNVHTVQFRPELYAPVAKRVRDYHGFDWDVGEETNFEPQFPFARNRVDWGTMYGDWQKQGNTIDVSLMFDAVLPGKWHDLEKDAFNYSSAFAKYFGPSGEHRLVEAIEIGNEPGKYTDAEYRKLFEHAARGVRAGDPQLLVASCNVSVKPSGDYHKCVDTIAGLESLYDVLNTHSYPELQGWPTWQRSYPEDTRLTFLKDIADLIAWRDQHAAGKQVWLTEFGYDLTTKPQDKAGTFKDWVGVTDTQQAQYLVRAFLILSELDLDRAYIFWFNDEDRPSVHGSSGLTRNYQPKPSFYAVAHLLKALGDFRFRAAPVKQPGEVYALEFEHSKESSQRVWVVWKPTGDGKASIASLRLPSAVERAERMPLTDGEPASVATKMLPSGEVEIEIGESPTYLWLKPVPVK